MGLTSRTKEHDQSMDMMDIDSELNELARKAGELALKHARHFDKHTKIMNDPTDIARLQWDDLQIGQLLGQGGYSDVHEVRIIRNDDEPNKTKRKPYDVEDSDHTSTSSSTSNTGDGSTLSSATSAVTTATTTKILALKHLKASCTHKEKTFKTGVIDLVMEGKLLSILSHENIIKLHATSSGCVSESYLNNNAGYFLVLDKLVGTVAERMEQWQIEDLKSRARTFRPSIIKGRPIILQGGTGPTSEHRRLLLSRIQDVALPVAHAMQYLHSKNIVFRDIKPANMGFDANGTIKLFDFGLAREIINPERRMTGNTGSLRYMAPEVARRKHYGLKVDVYSFGIFLNELCSLKKPFDGMTRQEFIEFVVFGDERPEIEKGKCGPAKVTNMMKLCWDENPHVRPTFEEICLDLQHEVAKLSKFDRIQGAREHHHAGMDISSPSATTATTTTQKIRSSAAA